MFILFFTWNYSARWKEKKFKRNHMSQTPRFLNNVKNGFIKWITSCMLKLYQCFATCDSCLDFFSFQQEEYFNVNKMNINFQCYKQLSGKFFYISPIQRYGFNPESGDHHFSNTLYICHRNGNFVERFSVFLSFLASIPWSFVNVYCYIHRCTEFNSRKPSLTQSIANRFTLFLRRIC